MHPRNIACALLSTALLVSACFAPIPKFGAMPRPGAADGVAVTASVQDSAATPLHLGWRWSPEGSDLLPIVAVDDAGGVYAADRGGSLYAISAPGEVRWQMDDACGEVLPPVINEDGSTLYAVGVAEPPLVCAISTAGEFQWSTPVPGLMQPIPTLAPDGALHLRTLDGAVRIDSDGGLEAFALPESITSPLFGSSESPLVSANGNIHFALPYQQAVLVLDQEYQEVATCKVGVIRSNLAPFGSDSFAIALNSGEIAAFHQDCSEQWRVAVLPKDAGDRWLYIAAGQDGTLLVGGPEGVLLALSDAGQTLWRSEPAQGSASLIYLAVGPDGTIAASGSAPPALLAFAADGAPRLAQQIFAPDEAGLPVATHDGGVVIVNEGSLDAYTDDPGLVIELPPPAAPPADLTAAEEEIAQFMVAMIVEDEIEGTLRYIEQTDWYGEGPTDNVIVWAAVANGSPGDSAATESPIMEGVPQLDQGNPRQVWTYGNGTLTTIADDADAMAGAIEAYENEHMQDTAQTIFAWGLYTFAIVEVTSDLQTATVYRSTSCGPLCGSGFLFTLQRAPDGRWFISDSEHLWQS